MQAKRKEQANNHLSRASAARGGQAVVIGGGIAGLSAAQVLVEHYEQVLVIDRDQLAGEQISDAPGFRAGIPQAHHAHTLLPYGQQVLDQLFPGLVDQLLLEGAPSIDDGADTAYYDEGSWRTPESRSARPTVSCSRPMLERLLYRYITGNARIQILTGRESTGLLVDASGSHVTGVSVRERGAGPERQAGETVVENLPADLVVDASGRSSKVPQWLANLGYTPPEEWHIDAYAGYASRIYRQPESAPQSWKKLYISAQPPDGLRGGVIIPLEGSRWHVTLFGLAKDYPPTDEAGFMAFARSLPTPALYDAIRSAEPLSRITGFRKNGNRVRRFDAMPRYLEGLLVLGDAAYIMNPIYALGMTAAAVSSQVLGQVLVARSASGPVGLAAAFQKKLAHRMARLWQTAVQNDWRWPATDISDNTEILYPVAG